ncbi:MAG: hypothetical protein JO311_06185 [Candidatus Eremiobacteraeota bacterium]|nr:hypothetical protein [Candidatus Eremiobacteraeota bacterium]MBV9264078.1 hypothetical protein [Candidatus Eremiobacteraeota bacterium]
MLLIRTVLSIAIVVCGAILLTEMFASIRLAGFMVLPGAVLGAAMVALGVHRLALIARVRGGRR